MAFDGMVVVCLQGKRFTTESAEDTEVEMKNPWRQECAWATRQDVLSGLREEGLEDLGAVVEDAADVGGDEEGVDEGAAENGVVNMIGDLGAVVLGDEAVFVAPEAVGAAELFVDEAMRWIPGGDFAFP